MKVIIPLLAFVCSLLPIVASAQLVPGACDNPNTCGSCEFVETINNVILFIVAISSLIAVIAFIYAGFLMVTSRGDVGQLTKAKGMFVNVVIGLILILASFVIVNTILSGLLNPGSSAISWQTVQCAYPTAATQPPAYNGTAVIGAGISGTGVAGSGVAGGPSGPLTQCFSQNSACSVSDLQAAGFTDQQANIMSCIAMTESSGQPSTPPYNETNPGSNSSACGTFQVTQTTWNNYPPSGSCSDWRSNCQNAACNAEAARNLVAANGYSDWTCEGCNTKAQGCIDQYGG